MTGSNTQVPEYAYDLCGNNHESSEKHRTCEPVGAFPLYRFAHTSKYDKDNGFYPPVHHPPLYPGFSGLQPPMHPTTSMPLRPQVNYPPRGRTPFSPFVQPPTNEEEAYYPIPPSPQQAEINGSILQMKIGISYVPLITLVLLNSLGTLGFLSSEECDHLITLATDKLEKAMVADNGSGESIESEVQTSSGMFFKKARVL
ncbi:hypothetical protein V6N11_035234 [Hibiscus sabdariffa]|uniref:Uncharacterized protein n=1 Tax=Hibiscus sabdariffa TaxID=183260 RepID=A0ABR2R092_9ROSI